MRLQNIFLKKTNIPIVMDLDSKRQCKCKAYIFDAVTIISHKHIIVSIVGLAEWDLHKCKK